MAAKVRIHVPGLGELSRAIAERLSDLLVDTPDVADLVILEGEGVKAAAKTVLYVGGGSEAAVRADVGNAPADGPQALGVGTVGITQRFRMLIARRCKVAVEDVQAYVAGDSGGVLVPLWSTAAIGAVPLHHWAVAGHGKLGVRDRVEIFQAAREPLTHEEQVEAALTVVDAIVNDRGRVLPVCAMLKEYAGMEGLCLSVPHVVNRAGAEVAVNVPLNPAERADTPLRKEFSSPEGA